MPDIGYFFSHKFTEHFNEEKIKNCIEKPILCCVEDLILAQWRRMNEVEMKRDFYTFAKKIDKRPPQAETKQARRTLYAKQYNKGPMQAKTKYAKKPLYAKIYKY